MVFDKELDYQYQPSKWAFHHSPEDVLSNFYRILSEGSKHAKLSLPCETNISYGLSDKQKVDIFGEDALPSDAPIFVFLHGGFWHEGCREESSHFAPTLFKAGIVSVVMGYDLSPSVTVDKIVDEIEKGMTFLGNRIQHWGTRNVFMCGHSAGAHLAAMLTSTRWMESEYAKPLKGLILISGIYELEPLLHTSVKEDASLTQEIIQKVSPMRYVCRSAKYLNCIKVIVAFADHDSPPFQKQSEEYEKCLHNSGVATKLLVVPESDHFSIIEHLNDPEFVLTKEIITFIAC